MLRASAGAAALAAAAIPAAARAAERPNILLLMTDQHRGDCIGADGNRVIHTPNFDRIAAEGALFHRAYSAIPSCLPARAALLTGLGPWRNGLIGFAAIAPEYPREKPRLLRDAGYFALGIGKMHFTPQRNLHGYNQTILDESGRVLSKDFISDYRSWFRRQAPALDPDATGIGWNDYRAKPYALPEELHPTRWTGDTAVQFIDGYRQPEPFFLKVSFARPHSPYDPPQRFFDMYAGAELPPAAVGDWAGRHATRNPAKGDSISQGDMGPEAVRSARQGYYGSISFIDEQVGRILAALERRGMLGDTLILVTADHGDMTGDHHLWRKCQPYEASARVPMLLRWPERLASGARRGQVLNQPVELRDVLPTFLDAAGAKFDRTDFDGRSLLGLVRGQTRDWREFIDLEHSRIYYNDNFWHALTDGHIKYVFNVAHGGQQLFDLDNDPHELRDLAASSRYRTAVADWRGRLIGHLAERGERFVANGDLVVGRKPETRSPNFPAAKKTSNTAVVSPKGA